MTLSTPIVSGSEWFVTKPVLEKSLAWQEGMLAVMVILACAGVAYVAIQAWRTRQWFPIYVCLGGALSCLYEPLGDLLAHVTYHEANQVTLRTAFGFHVPLWILPTYIVSFGVPIVLLGNLLATGRVGLAKWMAFFAVALAGGWGFEVPMLMMGAIEYYGDNQPFKILGFPVWMGFVNNATLFVVASLLHLFRQSDIGSRRPALVIVLMPVMVAGVHAGLSLPMGSTINGGHDALAVNLMALVSMALALVATATAAVLAMEPRRPLGAPLAT